MKTEDVFGGHSPPNAVPYAVDLVHGGHAPLARVMSFIVPRSFSSGSLLSQSGPSLP